MGNHGSILSKPMTWLNLCFKITLVTVDWGVGSWLRGAEVEEGNQLGCYCMRVKDDLGQVDGSGCRRSEYIWDIFEVIILDIGSQNGRI